MEEAYSNVIEVVVLDFLNASMAAGNADCENTADGSATVSVTGGLPPYQYLWDDGQTSAKASGLAPGTYNVTVTDDKDCQIVRQVTVDFDNAAPEFAFESDTLFFASEFPAVISAPSGFAAYNWSTGSADSTTTVSETGWYSLTVTSEEGCEAVDSVYVEMTVGLAEHAPNADVRVFPNPTRNEVNIVIGTGTVPELVEVRTLTGRVVNVVRNQASMQVSVLAAGVYLLDIRHEGQRWVKQLVVQ